MAALARGLNDGSSAENAVTVDMIDNPGAGIKTWVHTWNALADDGKTRQLHGDTEVKFTQETSKYVSYGFCIKTTTSEPSVFDCQQVDVTIDHASANGSKESHVEDFAIQDFYHNGDLGNFEQSKQVKDASNDWVIEKSENTYTQCTQGGDASNATICSSGINVRWARNFGTSEEAEDTQLSVDHADVAYPAFSFFYEWSDADHTTAPISATYNWHPTSVEMTPVTVAGVEAQDQALAAQPEVAESTVLSWLYEH